jgi:electron transfer flavoprotein beta subunit
MDFHVVCLVREIFDTRDLIEAPIDPSGNLTADNLESRFDPEDLNALEMAMKIKDDKGAKVTALSMGAVRRLDVLRECLYRGVDDVIRLEDPSFQKLDTLGASRLLGKALQELVPFDLVLAGIQISEGENGSLGGHVAQYLDMNSVSYVEEIEGIDHGTIRVRRAIEGGIEVLESPLPVLITVGVALLKEDPRTPRSPRAKLKLKHKKTPINTWGKEALYLAENEMAPATMVGGHKKIPKREIPFKEVKGDDMEALNDMVQELREAGCLR